MPRPLAICIESLNPTSETERFVRCVAKAGRGDGLALDTNGKPMFGDHHAVAPSWSHIRSDILVARAGW
jgi:hypothetical protein